MYLKTLTIRGFKSFASKTTFEFEPGITSVIGPNGSGKSNVVDALAWVMGEQGAKNLRGGKMEDVIFAGTTGRAPLGRAQVELTIDNTDGTLPIDFSEVTISRTLFRAGGSEYHINGEPARLLDIQELLSDSGLGREMHVIVGQGQLDRILQATPEERRGFIEEAAGILKHRRRKERSERKLESMRANLDRIRDLTEEVHRQLGPLSRQANTARKAQRIQHDVHDATARLLADDIVTQAARLQELEDSDRSLENRQQELTETLSQSEIRVQELSDKHTETSQAASKAREHRYQLTSLAERFRSLHALAQERYKTASRPAVASSGLSPEEATQQLEDNTAALNTRRQELNTLQEELGTAQDLREQAEKQSRIARETYTQLVREEADQQKSFAQVESKKSSAKTKLEALETQLARLSQDEAVSSENFAADEEEITEHETKLAEAVTTLEKTQQDRAVAQQQVDQARSAVSASEQTVNELKNQISGIQARIDVLAQSLQPAPGSAQAAIADYEPVDVSEILDIEPGWEPAIAALLAGSTDRLWLNTVNQATEVVQALEKQDVSDLRLFYPKLTGSTVLQALEIGIPAQNVIKPRQNQTQAFTHLQQFLSTAILANTVAEALEIIEQQVELFQEMPHLRIATKQGHIVTPDWLEVRGDGAVSTLEQRAAYDRAQQQLDELTQQLAEAQQAFSNAVEHQRGVRDKLKQSQGDQQEIQDTVMKLKERISLLKRNLEQQQSAQQRNQQQQTQLQTEIEQVRQTYETAVERYEAFQTAIALSDQSSGGVDDAAAAQQTAEQEATKARARETETRLALRTAENIVQQAQQRVEQSTRRLSAAKIAQQEYQRALVRQRHTIQRLTGLIEAVEVAVENITNSIDRADRDYQALEAQRAELVTTVEAAEQRTNATRSELSKIQEQIHQRRLIRQEHEIKLEQFHERALNELGYSHQYLVKNYGPDQPVDTGDQEDTEIVTYDRAEQQKRLRSAKRNLSALGKINPLALEEYAAVQERHEYLTQQLEDLESSRRDLLKIIEDVNDTVLKVFTSAYEDTAAQFQHVFSTLFPGGEGSLSLTEPDNMLETGIEVTARPAGKKVKRLSLLSGGERSLAAIALLVSIFKARPSPFYVMDEVEAALDDTNLSRLLTIFKELQVDSQLIIITHQKRTMEISDALYGVSMRGDGVSQVISQKLDHV